ncbi:hypothetical protein [Enterobacter phage 04_vB_Eclo_IJM]|nr:hypothetical protein [Enterobacter phage 04_vB_Eclo_IJM]
MRTDVTAEDSKKGKRTGKRGLSVFVFPVAVSQSKEVTYG